MWRYFLYENRVSIEIAETRELFSQSRLPKKPECSRFILLSSEECWSATLGRFTGSIVQVDRKIPLQKSFSKALISIYFDETEIEQARAKESQEIKNCIVKLYLRANESKRQVENFFMGRPATSHIEPTWALDPDLDGFALGREMANRAIYSTLAGSSGCHGYWVGLSKRRGNSIG